MDRLSFITQNYLHKKVENPCSEECCECEEVNNKVNPFHLASIAAVAFVCATILIQWNVKAGSLETFDDKRNNAIGCGYNSSLDKKTGKDSYNDQEPFDNKNRSNCPHQLGNSNCLCMSDSKRKKAYMLIT